MKKIFFAVVAAVIVCVCVSCNKNENNDKLKAVKLEKGILTTSDTKVVEIEFKKNESPYFDVFMDTGNEKDRIVWFAFYKATDIEKGGKVKQGKVPCRHYQVILPLKEKAKRWGYGPIVTSREDGTEHVIRLKLVNQPN